MNKALLEQIAAMRSYIPKDAFRQYCADAIEHGVEALNQGAFFHALEAALAAPALKSPIHDIASPVPENFTNTNLYHSLSAMMAEIKTEKRLSITDSLVQAVIEDLADIDCGEYKEVTLKPLSDEDITDILDTGDHISNPFSILNPYSFTRKIEASLLAKAGEK
jgi:hypothetical protein